MNPKKYEESLNNSQLGLKMQTLMLLRVIILCVKISHAGV